MEAAMKDRKQVWAWVGWTLVAALGALVVVAGIVKSAAAHLLFSGAMLLLMAVVGVVQTLVWRPGRDGETPSNAEKAAWSQIGFGLAAIMVLGGVSLGSMQGSWAAYLVFGTYALLVALFPVFRRRFVEENRRYREVAEDERDRAIRARGDYLSKRLLEFALVGMAIAWVAAPAFFRALGEPLQIASLLLLPALIANVIGEARIARLYWQDRQ